MTRSIARAARRLTCLACALALATACNRQAPAPEPASTPDPAPTPSTAPALADVSETTPDYIIGISYPPMAAKYPGLAADLRRYADAARAELVQAARQREKSPGAMPYDLSLSFTEVLDSPTLVAVAADGSSYTGGAHGAPLLARFVWLPREDQRLTAARLVPSKAGWDAISAVVREQLHTALSQRIDADDLPAGERAALMENVGRMIDEGTAPAVANFEQFEPVVDPAGKVTALRFVFAPYQVGPYSDGAQTVEVPASVLLPHVAPAYRGLFAGAAPAAAARAPAG